MLVEYCLEIYDSDASFGPGTKLGEAWDARNIGWSAYDRIPGKGFFTLSQTSPLLSLFVPLTTHVKLWRITSAGAKNVFSGPYLDDNSTGDDVVLTCFDYLSLLGISRAPFKGMYPTKKLGTEIVTPEWTAAKGATSSPLGFVTTGTIEDPLATDGVTPIKTSAQFGTLDQNRLQLFFDLSEIGRANTGNHVTFGITRAAPHTFSFRKSAGVSSGVEFVLNGNVSDYAYVPRWLSYRNDLASVGMDSAGGPAEIVKTNPTEITAKGLRQDVFSIQTLLGIAGAATEADQQQAATARALKRAVAREPVLQLRLARGLGDPFSGYEIPDLVLAEIANGRDTITGSWRVLGQGATVREGGEDPFVIVQPVMS